MNYSRTFDWASLLVFLTGLGSVWMAGGIEGPPAWVCLAAVAVVWRSGPKELSKPVQYGVMAVLLVLFAVDAFGVSGWGPSTVHLLAVLGLYKLLTRRGPSDYVVLYLVSFSLLLTASTFTLSIHFLAALVLFVLLSIFTFMLLENRPAYENRPNAPFPIRPYVKAALTLTGLTVLMAVPIFLAVPRGALGWLGSPGERVAGFSQSVDLGEIGRILGNSQVVMRVGVNREPDGLPADLRWRGVALDRFDGRTWINTSPNTVDLPADADGRHLVALERRQREELLEQMFQVEPFSNVLFAAPAAIQFAGFRTLRYRVEMDGNGAFLLRPRPIETVRYYVHSDLRPRTERLRGFRPGVPVAVELKEKYLQLPALDPRIPVLAAQVAGELPSPVLQAIRLEQYLKGNFRYTLENPSGGTADPLADFLFVSRAGHCEYFATAQAVLLRSLGIPSRVVNGFRAGQFNEWGRYFIVRQSDAHSWVEAYFPGAGWVEFDPTPAAPVSEFFLWRWAGLLADTADMLWSEVVTFDRWKQLGLFSRVRLELESRLEHGAEEAGRLLRKLAGLGSAPASLLVPLVEIAVAAAGLLLVIRLWRLLRPRLRRSWLRSKDRPPAVLARDLYLEFLEVADRRGFRRRAGETPGEFAERLGRAWESDLPRAFTRSYYRLRFGGAGAGLEELESAGRILTEVRRPLVRAE
ncbi:MAG: hypothetical protein Kow001_19810 [Acidobacteriota bacterium]